MPDISVKYKLKKEEAVETLLTVTKDTRKKKFIMVSLTAVLGMVMTCLISGEAYSIFLFGLLALLFPLFSYLGVKRTMEKSFQKSKIGRRDIELRFFSDHIEKFNCPDEERKSHEEIHYPLEAVRMVLESEKLYVFYISGNDIIQLPKRVLSQEDRTKIENLISNLFNHCYKKV